MCHEEQTACLALACDLSTTHANCRDMLPIVGPKLRWPAEDPGLPLELFEVRQWQDVHLGSCDHLEWDQRIIDYKWCNPLILADFRPENSTDEELLPQDI